MRRAKRICLPADVLPMSSQRSNAYNRVVVVDVLESLVAHFGTNFIIALAVMTVSSGETFDIGDRLDIPDDDATHVAPSRDSSFTGIADSLTLPTDSQPSKYRSVISLVAGSLDIKGASRAWHVRQSG